MSVVQALAKNSLLQITGKVLGTILGLVTFYLMLRFFGTEGFGLFTTAITYVAVFAILVDFGLTLTTTQMISKPGADEPKILGNLLSLRLISGALFMTLAPVMALFIPQSQGIMAIIVIASVGQYFGSVAQMFMGVFQKRLAILTAVFAETANRTVALVGIILAGLLGFGIEGASLAFVIGGLVQLSIMLGGTARRIYLRPQIDLKIWKQIVFLSWPIGVSIFFNLLYYKGDIIFMWMLNRSAEEIGQYGSAYKVVEVMAMIPITFMGLLLPLLTAAWAKRNAAEFKTRLQNGFDVFSIVAIPFAAGVIALGVPIMTAIRPDLVLAGQVLAILGPTTTIMFFGALYGHAVVAVNKQKPMTFGYILVAILAIAGYAMLIPIYGAWGAAWVSLGSELLITLLTFAMVTATTKVWPRLGSALKALGASLIMVAAIVLIPTPHAFISVPLGAVVYALALMLLGGPKPKDVANLFLANKTTAP